MYVELPSACLGWVGWGGVGWGKVPFAATVPPCRRAAVPPDFAATGKDAANFAAVPPNCAATVPPLCRRAAVPPGLAAVPLCRYVTYIL